MTTTLDALLADPDPAARLIAADVAAEAGSVILEHWLRDADMELSGGWLVCRWTGTEDAPTSFRCWRAEETPSWLWGYDARPESSRLPGWSRWSVRAWGAPETDWTHNVNAPTDLEAAVVACLRS